MDNILEFPENENLHIICQCGCETVDLRFIPKYGFYLSCSECEELFPTTPFELVEQEEIH